MDAGTTATALVAQLEQEFRNSGDAIKRLHQLALGAVGPSWSSEYSALQSQISDHLAKCRAHLFDLEVLADDVGTGHDSHGDNAAAQAAAGRQTLQRLMSELKAAQAAAARAASRRYADSRAQLLAGGTPAKDVRFATSASGIVSSSESITAGLKRIQALMTQELDVSGASLSLLDASTQKLASAATEYDGQHSQLKQSSGLLRVIKWQDLKETVLTYAGIAFFTAVCVYILVKRSAMFVPALPGWLAPAPPAAARNSSSHAPPVALQPGLSDFAGHTADAAPSDVVHEAAWNSGVRTEFAGSDDISGYALAADEYYEVEELQPQSAGDAVTPPLQAESSASDGELAGSAEPSTGSGLASGESEPHAGTERSAEPLDLSTAADGDVGRSSESVESEAGAALDASDAAPDGRTGCGAEDSAACERQRTADDPAGVDSMPGRNPDRSSSDRAAPSGLQTFATEERLVHSLPPAPRNKKKWQNEALDPQKQRAQQDIVHSRTKHIQRGAQQAQRQPTRSVKVHGRI